jgi:hypothetical protein
MITLEIAKSTRDRHADQLRKDHPSIVSIGIGLHTDKSGQEAPCISIGIPIHDAKKMPQALPAIAADGQELAGQTVAVTTFDEVTARILLLWPSAEVKTTNITRQRPCPGGYSMGCYANPTAQRTGTLGAPVYKKVNGQWIGGWFLSNVHVITLDPGNPTGELLVQPGFADDSTDPQANRVGSGYHLVRVQFGGPVNLVDAATGLTDQPWDDYVADYIKDIGKVTKQVGCSVGDAVWKTGRTTGRTSGKVTRVDTEVVINYAPPGQPARHALFRGQITTDALVRGGDSGSILLKKDTTEAVGLVFAASSDSTGAFVAAYANDIFEVFRQFEAKATVWSGEREDDGKDLSLSPNGG